MPFTFVTDKDPTGNQYVYDIRPDFVSEMMASPQVQRMEYYKRAPVEMLYNGEQIWEAAEAKQSVALLEQFAKGVAGKDRSQFLKQIQFYTEFNLWLRDFYKNDLHCDGVKAPGNLGGFGLRVDCTGWLIKGRPIRVTEPFQKHEPDFYGNSFMPITAIGYWVSGGGIDRTANVDSLNLKMTAEDFEPLKNMLADPSLVAGDYSLVDQYFDYNIFNKAPYDLPAAGLLVRSR